MKKVATIDRKKLQKALVMYRNYLNAHGEKWESIERMQAKRTLATLWVFFSETVKFDSGEGPGFEEDAESVNEFCSLIIEELTVFSKNGKDNKGIIDIIIE